MYEWNEAIEAMINWVEDNLTENPTLTELSQKIGYSPYYCSTQFHKISGMTLKSYVANRRLSCAAIELRDGSSRILDIAVKYGFSSQEALTRAFVGAFGCTPAAYRKNPIPIPMTVRKTVLYPYYYYDDERKNNMSIVDANVRIEHIPAHKYLGIWEPRARHYGEFWEYHNCDEICGIIESMTNVCHPIVTCHTAGYYKTPEGLRYFYGLGVPLDYKGEIPKGFELKEFPESYYLQFYHPVFDYLTENDEVMSRVERLCWGFNPKAMGYEWNEDTNQTYQRHYPEGLGYQLLRPIKKV